jgi:hypothetical protein
VYFENEASGPSASKLLSRSEARRIATKFAKLAGFRQIIRRLILRPNKSQEVHCCPRNSARSVQEFLEGLKAVCRNLFDTIEAIVKFVAAIRLALLTPIEVPMLVVRQHILQVAY